MSPRNERDEELDRLREEVAELKEALEAIRTGQVDALVDGTKLYTLESAESASNRFRGRVLQQISDTVIAVDTDYRITYLNEAAERQYGVQATDMLGKRLGEMYEYRWVRPEDEQLSMKALVETGTWRGENIHVRRDGSILHVESVVSVLRDADEGTLGYLAVMRDISERLKNEHALEEAGRQKDHFLATLAHELRNPLNPLMNGLQLLRMNDQDEPARQATQGMMQRQLDHLVRLVDDLMDMSRISRGKLELRMEALDMPVILSTAMETSKPLMEQYEHAVSIEIGEGRFPVIGDPTRLTQVVSNLLNNAAKYTPAGGRIVLRLAQEDGHAVVQVRDNGIGLKGDDLQRIFEMFAQVDRTSFSPGGLGIGLNIARRLVQLHGGTLTASSEGEGRGSIFTVKLPLKAQEHAERIPRPTDHADHTPALRILVVDDNLDGANSTMMLLKKRGHEVAVAYNGSEALLRGAELRPDLVLMDLGMPLMDGYEACSRMRKLSWGQRALIVALSGWGQPQDRERSTGAGFDEHLVKPIERHTMDRIVQRAHSRDRERDGQPVQ